MARKNKFNADVSKFKTIVGESFSVREVASKLGYKESGGIYKYLKLAFSGYGLDTSHFTGQRWNAGKTRQTDDRVEENSRKIEWKWEEIFCKNSLYKGGGAAILSKLVKSGKRDYCCEECGSKDWMNKPLCLQLDHKNGDNQDNREFNLRILCPNCHSQTETFSRRKSLFL